MAGKYLQQICCVGKPDVQKAGEVASNCIDSIVTFFSELPGKIWNWLTDAFNRFVTWGSNTLQKAREVGANTIDTIVNFFSQLPGKIWTWLSNTIQKVIQWGSDMVAKGRQAASDLCSAVINGVANLPSQMAMCWLQHCNGCMERNLQCRRLVQKTGVIVLLWNC